MFRVFVLYERAPEPERYREHLEVAKKVPGVALSHGPVVGSPRGEARYAYCAQLDFADREALDRALDSPEMMAAGDDAMAMGIPFELFWAELREAR